MWVGALNFVVVLNVEWISPVESGDFEHLAYHISTRELVDEVEVDDMERGTEKR